MPDIHSYVELVQLILSESAKYFALLLLAVLAVRIWRRLPKLSGSARRSNLLLGVFISLLAAGVGYLSFCHSMSLMYWHFGLKALQESRIDPAYSLFDTSWRFHKNPDALGGKGVCFLMSGHSAAGIALIDDASAMRHGQGSPFESFYKGLYYFYNDDPTNAVPPLETAAADARYTWEVTKLFAVIQLDRNQPKEAARLMQPYLEAPVTGTDHAYVIASLDLADGRKAEAQALLDKYDSADLGPFWHKRFERLKASLQNENK